MTNLVTFAELKTFLELTKNEADYPVLTQIQDSVKSAIESFINAKVDFDTYTETFEPNEFIILSALPVSSIASVTQDGNIIDSDNYKIRPWGVTISGGINWTDDLIVQYTGGFETVPTDLNRAALLQTVYEYQNKDHVGANSVSNEGGFISVPEIGLLKEVQRLLRTYKHPGKELF